METALDIGAMWHVLRRIKSSLIGDDKKVQLNLYEYKLGGSAPAPEHQLMALHKLRTLGVIDFTEDKLAAGTWEDSLSAAGFTYTEYILQLANELKLDQLYSQYEKLVQDLAKQQPIAISYEGNGIGHINGKPFKIGGKNKRVFDVLYKGVNQWVLSIEVLKAIKYSKANYTTKAATLEFNTKIGNLRKALKVSKHQIEVANNHARLKAKIIEN